MPDVDMGNNLVEAIFIGISSGASSVGINQIGKQLNKDDLDNFN
jgi:cysteine synthase